jgi:uncharacterized membrane protein
MEDAVETEDLQRGLTAGMQPAVAWAEVVSAQFTTLAASNLSTVRLPSTPDRVEAEQLAEMAAMGLMVATEVRAEMAVQDSVDSMRHLAE